MISLRSKWDLPNSRVIGLVQKLQSGQATHEDKGELWCWIWNKSYWHASRPWRLKSGKWRPEQNQEDAESIADKIAERVLRTIQSTRFTLEPILDRNIEQEIER